MTYYRFKDEDIIDTQIVAQPQTFTEMNGNQVTGSIFLEKSFLNSDLNTRLFEGFSAKEGGLVQKRGPFTASIDFMDSEFGASNKQLYQSLIQLYDYYSAENPIYTPNVTGSITTNFRVISIPELYYDRRIVSGTFSASDYDSAGAERKLFDNGIGGIYSGSLTGSIVGNIFYNEGLVVLKVGNLTDFGEATSSNLKWRVSLKGTHTIPVKIFRCRAPAGDLNASTNSTFYTTPESGDYKNERVRILTGSDNSATYITSVGLYNDNYDLVCVAKLAQPIRKHETQDLQIRIRYDW